MREKILQIFGQIQYSWIWQAAFFCNFWEAYIIQCKRYLLRHNYSLCPLGSCHREKNLAHWYQLWRKKLGTLVSALEKKTWHIGISYGEEPGVFVSAWFCFGKQEPFFVMVGLSLTRLFMIILMSLINDHVRQRRMVTRMIWSTGKKSSAWWWSLVLPNFLWCALWITLWSRWRHLWWWRWCWSWWNSFVYFQLSFLKLSATEWRWHRQELWVIVEGILCTASHLFTEHSSISIFNFPLVFATWTARKCKMIKLFAFAQVLHAVSGNLHS